MGLFIKSSLLTTLFALAASGIGPVLPPEVQAGERGFFYEQTIDDNLLKSNRSMLETIGTLFTGSPGRQLNLPVDIIAGENGSIAVLNQESGTILLIDQNNRLEKVITRRRGVPFRSLVGGCYVPGGLLVADSAEGMIYRVSPSGDVSPFCEPGILVRPSGVALCSSTGEIWVTEAGAHRLSRFSPEGKLIARTGTRGTAPGEFNFPTGIASDCKGLIYIVDALNFRIQVADSEGNFLKQFGKAGDSTGSFARPRDITVDKDGLIYVTDLLMNNVQVFDQDGRLLSYFGKIGDGQVEFRMPSGIAAVSGNRILVSDSHNNRIQVFKQEISWK